MPSKIFTRVLLGLTGLALLGLSNCAYQETMNQRNAESYQLQRELEAEKAREETLRR